jgi:hypothetical protein
MPLVAVCDVAKWLGVSSNTVYRLVNRGDLPAPTKGPRGSWTWSPELVAPSLSRLAWRYRGEPATFTIEANSVSTDEEVELV